MPGQDYGQADVKCPFYVKNDSKSRRIFCEGFCNSLNLSLNFGKYKRAYREYKADYCDSFSYQECPIYKMLADENQ